MYVLANKLTHSQGSTVFCLTSATYLRGPPSKPFVAEGIDGLLLREHFRSRSE